VGYNFVADVVGLSLFI